MSSRKEEKERLRREREEAERAAAASQSRRRMLTAVLGGVLLVAAVAAIAIFALGGDDGDGPGGGDDGVAASLPAVQTTDFEEAVDAAGCRLQELESEGAGHTTEDVEYESSPPTSGAHDPMAAQDGIYPEPPDVEPTVHSLEHGRVNIQYAPGTPARRVAQLEALFNEDVRGTAGWHTLLFENQTNMDAAVAAASWTRSLTCPEFNDRVFDALRAFRLNAVVGGEWAGDIPEPNVP